MCKFDYSKVVTKNKQGYKVLHGTFFEKTFNSKTESISYLNRVLKESENLNRLLIVHSGYMIIQDERFIDLAVTVLQNCQRNRNILKYRSGSFHIHLINNTLQTIGYLSDCPVFSKFQGVVDSFLSLAGPVK